MQFVCGQTIVEGEILQMEQTSQGFTRIIVAIESVDGERFSQYRAPPYKIAVYAETDQIPLEQYIEHYLCMHLGRIVDALAEARTKYAIFQERLHVKCPLADACNERIPRSHYDQFCKDNYNECTYYQANYVLTPSKWVEYIGGDKL